MKRLLTTCLLIALIGATSGCNYVVLLGYLIGGPPSIEPDYDAMTSESLTNPGIVVAVACFATKEVLYSFAHVDRDIAVAVAAETELKARLRREEAWSLAAKLAEAEAAAS